VVVVVYVVPGTSSSSTVMYSVTVSVLVLVTGAAGESVGAAWDTWCEPAVTVTVEGAGHEASSAKMYETSCLLASEVALTPPDTAANAASAWSSFISAGGKGRDCFAWLAKYSPPVMRSSATARGD